MGRGNLEKGLKGEDIACEYIIEKGYQILERNFRLKTGEIDIIARKENLLVIIEVKTRTNINFGYPYEAVNKRKQDKIIKTALYYVKLHGLRNIQLRFDIIEVYLGKESKINHYENAFM